MNYLYVISLFLYELLIAFSSLFLTAPLEIVALTTLRINLIISFIYTITSIDKIYLRDKEMQQTKIFF